MQVILFAAQSLDGWITRQDQPGDGFASAADRDHFRAELAECDACVMGAATYVQSRDRLDPRRRPELRRVVWTRRPEAYAAEAVPGALEFTAEAAVDTAARLLADGRRRCALLGGGRVNAVWLAAGLVDELRITVESRIFGYGVPLADARATCIPPELLLELREARSLAPGGPLLLRYGVLK